MVNEFPFGTSQPEKWDYLFRISVCPGNFLACLWLGALSNKGGREQRNREEIGAGATFSRSFAARSRALRGEFCDPRLRLSCARLDKTAIIRKLGIFQWDEPKKRLPFTSHPEFLQEFVVNGKQPVSGAPNDGFLLNVLKSHFRLFRVL